MRQDKAEMWEKLEPEERLTGENWGVRQRKEQEEMEGRELYQYFVKWHYREVKLKKEIE